jgi:hypothetical protein
VRALNEATRHFGFKATLKRHKHGNSIHALEGKKAFGSVGDIPPDVEEKIFQHVLKLEQCLELHQIK